MDISIIVATDLNGGIGKNGKMPWNNDLKKDLSFFKGKTLNSNIIMGKNTMLSLPNGFLKNRKNIVISNSKIHNENILVANDIESALKLCDKSKPIFIIGGESIYNQFLNIANKIYLTKINNNYDCDRFFPTLSDEWFVDFESKPLNDNNNIIQFLVYKK